MKSFEEGDRVIINDTLPLLVGETGTVMDPDYLDHVIVLPDAEDLRKNAITCFLPEELDLIQ